MAEPIETLVREAIFSLFHDKPDFIREFAATDHEGIRELRTLHEQLVDDTNALDELVRDYYVDREITKCQFVKCREILEDRIEVTKRAVAGMESDRFTMTWLTTVVASGNVRNVWENATLDWRRRLLDALIESIVILPQATSTFEPRTIQIKWRV